MLVRTLMSAVFCLLSSQALSVEAYWDAAGTSQGLTLVTHPERPVEHVADGTPCVRPAANPDFMTRRGVLFRVEAAVFSEAPTVYAIVDYLDTRPASIEVRYDASRQVDDSNPGDDPASATAIAVAGYIGLGSGARRTAVFELESPAFQHRRIGAGDVEVQGCPGIVRLTLSRALDDSVRVRAEAPVEAPRHVTLQRPVELVISAGGDASTPDGLPGAIQTMRQLCPLFKALGFTAVESYVKWNFVEPERGRFDWSFYDGIMATASEHGLQWFPLLIVGSAYSLPEWYFASPENTGFVCLEHGMRNNVQTIFNENQTPHVTRFMKAFGEHYGTQDALLGVRLGPSGNYGESQYPAAGSPMGYKGEKQHIHLGWWAADHYAPIHFQNWLKKRYATIDQLNDAWDEYFVSFDEIDTFLPNTATTDRMRKDFVDWYLWAMTDWCERWAVWAREAMPDKAIYQSSGGWGFVESGTDFTDQTRSMTKVKGGIRATNETDSYAQNFYVTRMMSSSARFYGVPFGSEPAGFGTARGVISRLYNIIVNNGQHLFYYSGNFLSNDQAIEKWIRYAPLLDKRADPIIDVAVMYPDTKSKLDDGVFRNLYSSTFNPRVVALRSALDFDYCSEQMVIDGALDRYKVLCFLWSNVVEADALERIDAWVRAGGTAIYPYCWPRYPLGTVEGDYGVYNRWLRGDTGKGKVLWFKGNHEPPHLFADFIKDELLKMEHLAAGTQAMLRIKKPPMVYVSALRSGEYALLNYHEDAVTVTAPQMGQMTLEPISITMVR